MSAVYKQVLIINPPSGLYRRDDRCQSRVEEQTVQVIFPPIDLAYLAAMALESGASVHISDYPAEKRGWEAFIADLHRLQPDLLLFDVTTATLLHDLWACRIAKELLPDITTAAKGDYLSLYGESVLKEHPELDIVLSGEAEDTMAELVTRGYNETTQGILFRTRDDTIVSNPARPFIEDLDKIPFPARALLNNELYQSPETHNKLTVVHTNRGCPAQCIFCPAGRMSGHKIRFRSPHNIVKELVECVEKHDIHEFLLHGDTFTMKKSWVIDLCKLMIDSNIKIRWGCNSRVDTIDDERAEWLHRAGCWVVAFGVESGSQHMLERMKKGTHVEQAVQAIDICKRHGLLTHAFFIIGLPWETDATLKETYRLIQRLDTDFFDINIAYPLPGTDFFDIALKDNLFVSTHAVLDGSYGKAAVRSYELSAEELNSWRRQALLKLYLRPRYITRTLIRAAHSPVVLTNYISSAFNRLRYLLTG